MKIIGKSLANPRKDQHQLSIFTVFESRQSQISLVSFRQPSYDSSPLGHQLGRKKGAGKLNTGEEIFKFRQISWVCVGREI